MCPTRHTDNLDGGPVARDCRSLGFALLREGLCSAPARPSIQQQSNNAWPLGHSLQTRWCVLTILNCDILLHPKGATGCPQSENRYPLAGLTRTTIRGSTLTIQEVICVCGRAVGLADQTQSGIPQRQRGQAPAFSRKGRRGPFLGYRQTGIWTP